MSQAGQSEILRAPALPGDCDLAPVLLSLLGVALALPGDCDLAPVLLSLPLVAPALPGDRPVLLGLLRLRLLRLLLWSLYWASPSD